MSKIIHLVKQINTCQTLGNSLFMTSFFVINLHNNIQDFTVHQGYL